MQQNHTYNAGFMTSQGPRIEVSDWKWSSTSKLISYPAKPVCAEQRLSPEYLVMCPYVIHRCEINNFSSLLLSFFRLRYIRQKCSKILQTNPPGTCRSHLFKNNKQSFSPSSQSRGFFIIVQTLSKNVGRGLFLNQISADFINLISHSFVFPLFTSLLTSHIHSTVFIFLHHPFHPFIPFLPSPSFLPPVALLLMALLIFSSSFFHFFSTPPHPCCTPVLHPPPLSLHSLLSSPLHLIHLSLRGCVRPDKCWTDVVQKSRPGWHN